jgi:hypothetical protein
VSELIQTQDGAQTENKSASTAEILWRFIWRFILGLVLSALPLLVVSWGGVMECSLPLVILTGVVGLPDDADRRWYITCALLLGLATFAAGAFFHSVALLALSVITLSTAVIAQRDSE